VEALALLDPSYGAAMHAALPLGRVDSPTIVPMSLECVCAITDGWDAVCQQLSVHIHSSAGHLGLAVVTNMIENYRYWKLLAMEDHVDGPTVLKRHATCLEEAALRLYRDITAVIPCAHNSFLVEAVLFAYTAPVFAAKHNFKLPGFVGGQVKIYAVIFTNCL
jgi:hypothetical protein